MKNGRDTESKVHRRPFECGRRQSLTCTLDWLFLRKSPLKKRFTAVDAVSKPTPRPPRNSIRARAEKCLHIVDAREEITTSTCMIVVVKVEL